MQCGPFIFPQVRDQAVIDDDVCQACACFDDSPSSTALLLWYQQLHGGVHASEQLLLKRLDKSAELEFVLHLSGKHCTGRL